MEHEPPVPETEADRAQIARVQQHGWAATHVMGDGDEPPFSYTTGLNTKLGAPELIVLGLPQDSAELLFATYVRELEMGGLITSGRTYKTFLEGLSVQFLDLDPSNARLRNEFMTWTFWYYGGANVAALQLVWPDAEDRMPWEPDFDARLHAYQPLLGDAPTG